MKTRADFKTQKEFLTYLVKNKAAIIDLKKSALKFSEPFAGIETEVPILKSLSTNYTDDVTSGIIKRTVIGNTYYWMDSHDDVHVNGIFTESISERKDKIWHLHDHEYKITSKVGKPISIYEKTVSWSDLVHGNKRGNTTALFMDSEISKTLNPLIYEGYLSKQINQHSVAMIYEQIQLAVNDEEMENEYETWNKYIDLIGNKSKAMDAGYFWAVEKAKLVEISCVLEGSNELTPTVPNNEKSIEVVIEETETESNFYYEIAKHFRN